MLEDSMSKAWIFALLICCSLVACEKPCKPGYKMYGVKCVKWPLDDGGADAEPRADGGVGNTHDAPDGGSESRDGSMGRGDGGPIPDQRDGAASDIDGATRFDDAGPMAGDAGDPKPECSPNPCLHGGRCSALDGDFTCNCADTGYAGTTCQKDVDECAAGGANNCDANAACMNDPGTFTCQCKDPYVGNGTSCKCPTGYAGAECVECASGYANDGTGACVLERTLTVTLAGDGFGAVSFSNGTPACSKSCSIKVPDGAVITLTGAAKAYSKVLSWSAQSCSGTTCSVAVSGNRAVTVTFQLAHNVAFIASPRIRPNFGGIAQADKICADAARAGDLHGTKWVAWLATMAPCPGSSTGNCNPGARLEGTRGWVRPDGVPVGDTVSSMISEGLYSPLKVDEHKDLASNWAFTGVSISGTVQAGKTCADWTGAGVATRGDGYRVAPESWLTRSESDCENPERLGQLFCFGADEAAPLVPPAATGRRAFVSKALFIPNGGIAGADAACAAEANQAGLNGTFLALLGTTTKRAADRFDLTGAPWYRVDGFPWLEIPSYLATGSNSAEPKIPLNVWSDGGRLTYGAADLRNLVWTGGEPWLIPTNNCSDWQSVEATTTGQLGDVMTDGLGNLNTYDDSACSGKHAVYCLQQ